MITMRKTLERNRLALLLVIFLVGCLLTVTPVAAIHDVSVSIDQPGGPCTDATKCIIFTIDKGVSANINGFLVSFPDENVDVPSVINPACIEVSWYDENHGGWTTPQHPPDVEVFYGQVPGHPTPKDGMGKDTTTIKIWSPVSVPTNKKVRICFLPCADLEMKKCDFYGWVSTDLEPYDTTKDSDFKSDNTDSLQYDVTIIQNKGGKIIARSPSPYDCGDQPVFDITADPGYTICQVCVKKLDSSNDPCYTASACDPGIGTFTYDSKHSTFKFDPLHECWEISATFRANVTVYLKYQNATADCGDISAIGSTCDFIYSTTTISDALDFVDCLYIGGDSAEFSLDSTRNRMFHPTYGNFMGGTWNDGPPVGESAYIDVPSNPDGYTETETFQVTVNLNDGTQIMADPVTITGPGQYTLTQNSGQPLTNMVNVENVVGIDAGPTCLYQDFFAIFGVTSGICYGNYGYPPAPSGQWNDGKSLGESVCVDITTPPTVHCAETYLVTYVGDDATTDNQATLIIVNDKITVWWAPQNDHRGPTNIVDILDVEPQMPAWQMHTQCWIDKHPEFEGLIGALIVVDNGIYKETFEMDTPGVVLKAKNKGGAVIDAFGIKPAFNDTEFPLPGGRAGAVFITAGCTELNGFVIKNAGRCNGGSPDVDGNGYMDAAGVVVHPSSWKCAAALIDLSQPNGNNEKRRPFPCCEGRVNIINNTIYNSTAEGILANNAVVLVEGNDVYQNCWDGFAGEELKCGVECIDPYAITHCYRVVTEILFNKFHDNGCGKMSSWEGRDCKDTSRVSFSTAFLDAPKYGDPYWIDAGIEIRSVLNCCCRDGESGSDGFDGLEVFDGYYCRECGSEQPFLEFSNPFIIGNKIYNNAHAGINLLENAVAKGNCDNEPYVITEDANISGIGGDEQGRRHCEQHLTIIENEITNNKVFGISSFADPAPIIIKYNDIAGNKWWGIKNFVIDEGLDHCDHCETDLLIAKENWWGKIGGPSMGPAPICHERDERSLALGNGDAVSELVEYNPWLTQPFAIVLKNDPVRWYGSDTLELQAGWNTLSVPLTLDDRADTILEISNLGKFLTPDNFIIAYQFNAVSRQFEPISPNLIPCRGYYIKVKEDTQFPVLYSGSESPGLPSYALVPGWNLVGSAFGIDKKDNKIVPDEGRWAVANPDSFPRDPEAEMSAEEALDSLMSISPRGLSTVISPSVPGQIQSWALTADDLGKKDLYTGEGYWVFMVNPGTLSGFEITPFHFEFELPT